MEFLTAIVSEIAKSLLGPIGRQIGYLLYYNSNVKNLEFELQKLDDKKAGVKLQVDEAKRNLNVIAPEVVRWQEQVEATYLKAQEFLRNEIKVNNRCLKGHCTDPKSRYSLSRNAKKMSEEVLSLLQEAGNFNQLAYPAPPPKIGPMFDTEGIKDFHSRESLVQEIWEFLKNDDCSMISICGMGGVGKTTMVQKLVKRVERENLFGVVAMATVSQQPDLMKIQSEIALSLGLKFEDSNPILLGRATKLLAGLEASEKRILLILDDVWNTLNLKEIGLLSKGQKKGYKVLLTSRYVDVCKSMGSEKDFLIEVLSDDEAWELFSEMAGHSVNKPDLHPVARQVQKECGGLPIAIVTVARALENQSKDTWDGALQDLKKSRAENIHGMQNEVYSRIELSFNYLGSKEAKLCFLLCCLFPEDCNVLVEDLVRYGMGMRWIEDVDDLHQARKRVHMLIKKLKRSFLLLDGDEADYEYVKMHDLVRDVAIRIAFKEEFAFLIRCDAVLKDWPRTDRYELFSTISLVCEVIKEHPENLHCPKLELLQLVYGSYSQSLPNNFFEGMKNLKVLTMSNPAAYEVLHLLPHSLKILPNLRSLYLKNCQLQDISIIVGLEKLEILGIVGCELRELTKEILKLKNLMLLELRNCEIRYIEPGALSGLSKLEELYVIMSFVGWGSVGDDGKINASLSEFESLHLHRLRVEIPHGSLLPTELVFRCLSRFRIFVGLNDVSLITDNLSSKNVLRIKCFANDIMESGIHILFKITEVLELRVDNLININDLDKDGFPCLQELKVGSCYELEYIIDARKQILHSFFPQLSKLHLGGLPNLKETWHGELPRRSSNGETMLGHFGSLRDIYVESCEKLKYVFALSIANCFNLLTSLTVSGCPEIQGILFKKGTKDEMKIDEVELPHLTYLRLDGLPKLISFCLDMDNAGIDQCISDNPAITRCSNYQSTSNDIQKWSTSQEDKTTKEVTSLMKTSIFFPPPSPRLPNLKKLHLFYCDVPEVLFSLPIAAQFDQLEELRVMWCQRMKYIVAGGQEAKSNGVRIFPKLNHVEFSFVLNMVSFYYDASTFSDGQSPKQLLLNDCPEVKKHYTEITMENMEECNTCQVEEETNIVHDQLQVESYYRVQTKLLEMTCTLFSSDYMRLAYLRKLHMLHCDFPNVVFSPMAAKQLEQLEELKINYCKRMEWIIAGAKLETNDIIVFPKLKSLELEDLPNLIGLCPYDSFSFDWPMLKSLVLLRCPKLVNFGSTVPVPPTYFDEKTKQVILSKANLSEAHCAIPSKSFEAMQNLERLEVVSCEFFQVVFSLVRLNEEGNYVVLSLSCLKELVLKNLPNLIHLCCKMPQDIKVDLAYVFPQLKSLTLDYLPNLISFLPHPYTSEWPYLEYLKVKLCEGLKIFGPEIQQNTVDAELKELSQSRYCSKTSNALEKAPWQSLKTLCIGAMDGEWKWIGHEKILDGSSIKLTHLEVIDCYDKKVVSGNLIANLQQLKTLTVKCCFFMVGIFEYDQEVNVDRGNSVIFSNLQEIRLLNLPELIHLFNKIPRTIVEFQNLSLLELDDCESLRNIFSVSMVAAVPQLQILKLKSCRGLKEIVAKEDEQETRMDKIVFPQLRSLEFDNLGSLQSFYNGDIGLHLPSLQEVRFSYLNKMKTFSYGSLSTPALSFILVMDERYHFVLKHGDLNTIVNYLFQEKSSENAWNEESE